MEAAAMHGVESTARLGGGRARGRQQLNSDFVLMLFGSSLVMGLWWAFLATLLWALFAGWDGMTAVLTGRSFWWITGCHTVLWIYLCRPWRLTAASCAPVAGSATVLRRPRSGRSRVRRPLQARLRAA